MTGKILALLGLTPLVCSALSIPVSLHPRSLLPTSFRDSSFWFPLPNSTFWINPNGTLADNAAARTTTANEWVSPFPMSACFGHELEEATIDDMHSWLKTGSLTSEQLTSCYLSRIDQVNKFVKGVTEVNPDALKIAKKMDEEMKSGNIRGSLHGIPFIIKDNIATKDKMQTTAGWSGLIGSIVPRDAHVVALLRDAGAVLIGKATMDEFAQYRDDGASSGFSTRGGQPRNAYNLSQAAAGSSTGSGIVVTSNMAAFALATETDGSVIAPARRSGIVGIKPTVGLTSRAGVIPLASTQDTVGVHGRTVRDAVLALEAIVGHDGRDNYTDAQVGKIPQGRNYRQFLRKKEYLNEVTLGLPWETIWAKTEPIYNGGKPLMKIAHELSAQGVHLVNGTEIRNASLMGTWGGSDEVSYEFTTGYRMAVGFYNDFKKYMSEVSNTNIRSVEDIVAYNKEYTGEMGGIPGTLAGFPTGQSVLDGVLVQGGIINETYHAVNAFMNRISRDEGIDWALNYEGKKIDALLQPSAETSPAAAAGYPQITVPAGINPYGVPYGISVVGTAFSEPKLIMIASALEDYLQAREKPLFYEYWARNIPVNY